MKKVSFSPEIQNIKIYNSSLPSSQFNKTITNINSLDYFNTIDTNNITRNNNNNSNSNSSNILISSINWKNNIDCILSNEVLIYLNTLLQQIEFKENQKKLIFLLCLIFDEITNSIKTILMNDNTIQEDVIIYCLHRIQSYMHIKELHYAYELYSLNWQLFSNEVIKQLQMRFQLNISIENTNDTHQQDELYKQGQYCNTIEEYIQICMQLIHYPIQHSYSKSPDIKENNYIDLCEKDLSFYKEVEVNVHVVTPHLQKHQKILFDSPKKERSLLIKQPIAIISSSKAKYDSHWNIAYSSYEESKETIDTIESFKDSNLSTRRYFKRKFMNISK